MTSKTLQNKITKQMKKDVCCEEYMDRSNIVELIMYKYIKVFKKLKMKDEPKTGYIDWIKNDISLLLNNKSDINDEVDNLFKTTGGMEKFFYDIPLSFLLTMLGYISYKEYN